MKKKWRIISAALLVFGISMNVFGEVPSYYNQEEYSDELTNNYSEDRGIVVENNPTLGYLVYKNTNGLRITRNYYAEQVSVEKKNYYDQDDKIGYLDELFPNFKYDARDSKITSIQPGDSIYIRTNSKNEITYINATNDYIMRYGKVISYDYNTGDAAAIMIEDENGNIYSYSLPLSLSVTKGGKPLTITSIQPGQWVKILIAQRILGQGIIDEKPEEIVIDNDTRYISNVYRGQMTSLDLYNNKLNLKNVQALGKTKWSEYKDIFTMGIDAAKAATYVIGNRVSADYMARNLKNADGYVYIAAESYKGKENAMKLNFQSKLQTTLTPSTVTYVSAGVIKLLSGETLYVADDAIVVRDKRLVSTNNIMVGDVMQAVVSGENKLAVANITTEIASGSLEVFRGRIKKIKDREEFQVETFSLLDENLWYYHPTPRTFSIDNSTKFYKQDGMTTEGIDKFIAYGDNSEVGNVYTIIAQGNKAYAITEMPYIKDAVKGTVYSADGESIKLKDVYYYNTSQKRWMEYSQKNVGATITLAPNTMILKNGKLVSADRLENGDAISAMVDGNLKDKSGTVPGYILVVEN